MEVWFQCCQCFGETVCLVVVFVVVVAVFEFFCCAVIECDVVVIAYAEMLFGIL